MNMNLHMIFSLFPKKTEVGECLKYLYTKIIFRIKKKKQKVFVMKIYEIHTLNSDAEHITTIKVDGDKIEVISARDDWDDDIKVTIKEKSKR